MTKEFFDCSDHQLNGESGFVSHWGNFGYWSKASTYPEACEALAIEVADAAGLDAQSHLLDCGFGCGDQLLTWINRYAVASIVGVNLSVSQTEIAKHKIKQRSASYTRVVLHQGDVLTCFANRSFTEACDPISHIIALDCAYHFVNRAMFFQKAYSLLAAEGKIALTDITFCEPPKTLIARLRFKLAACLIKLAKIPPENMLTLDQYKLQLARAGFKAIDTRDITEPVFAGFCQWLPEYKRHGVAPDKLNWTKYNVTRCFLSWATRHGIIEYQLISASK